MSDATQFVEAIQKLQNQTQKQEKLDKRYSAVVTELLPNNQVKVKLSDAIDMADRTEITVYNCRSNGGIYVELDDEVSILAANGNLNNTVIDWNKTIRSPAEDRFTMLLDTPWTYLSSSLRSIRVNSTEDGLEFGDVIDLYDTFIKLIDTPTTYVGQGDKITIVNAGETALEFDDEPVIIDTFLGLLDTPNDYTGSSEKILIIKSTENGIEFQTYVPPATVSTFLELTDSPSSYTGQSGNILNANSGETALEYISPPTVVDDNIRASWDLYQNKNIGGSF